MESQPVVGPERRIVTVLFADLVGFTSLAERLDPEDLAIVQDAYFAAVRDVVGRHRGRVEKFIGDAAMAAFGLPWTLDDDALRAVSAGLALLNAIGDLGPRLGLDTDELRLRIGVNTGEVAVAAAGPDEGRLSGDVVNVAARLQTAAAPGTMLVGEVTALAVAGAIELAPATSVVLKGKSDPVRAAEALAIRAEPSRESAMGRLRSGLLGRSEALATLRTAAERAAARGSPRILVVAPPGVGKTRLVEEFASTLDPGSGWQVLRVRVPPQAVTALEPIARLVAAALGAADAVDTTGSMTARLGSALAAAGASPGRAATVVEHVRALLSERPAASPTDLDRASLFGSWLQALDALAGGRHPAWLIDDLHWAERDTFDFLEAAGAVAPKEGRLIVATGRPAILELGAFAGAGWDRIDLPTLAPADARALVEELAASAIEGALAERIVAHSDGNCLFIEELLRTWVGSGILVADETGRLRLTVAPDDVPLPPTVQAIYAAQLDDLPAPARMATRRGSVAGRRFPSAALAPLGVGEPLDAIAALVRRGLVSGPDPAPVVGDEYAFRHALLRDTGYASLGRAERSELHVRLARWLEDVAGDRSADMAAVIGRHYADAVLGAPVLAAQVAHGLDRATAAALAATWLERAGEGAFSSGGRAGAADLFRRSIDQTAPAARLDLARRWRRLGDSIVGTYDLEDAADAFLTASDRARAVVHDADASPDEIGAARRELATSAASLSRARFEQIRFAEAQQVAEDALAIVGEDEPESIRLRLARLRGIEGVGNDYERVFRESGPLLDDARATGDAGLEFEARAARLGFATEVGKATADEWIALAREAQGLERWPESVSEMITAAGIMQDTDREAVGALLDEAEDLAEARGLNQQLAWISLVRTTSALVAGDWDVAVAAALNGIGTAERYRYDRAAVRTWFALTPMADARGDRATLARAADWFEAHRTSYPDSPYGLLQHAAVDLRIAAVGLGPGPDLEDERLLAGLALDDDSAEWLAAIERVIGGAVAVGRPELARTMIERLPPVGTNGARTLAGASHGLCRGILAASLLDEVAATTAAREALVQAREAGAPWWVARSVRLLERLGAASPAELDDAAAAERRLGLAGQAQPSGGPPVAGAGRGSGG